MRLAILLIFVLIKVCSSSVVFQINSNNENVTINSSYFFGTIHIAQDLLWPYLSNKTLQILNESDQIWVEHDFTDPEISKYIYWCSVDQMTIKRRASLRAKSWSRFLNETKGQFNNGSTNSNNLERWRQWFADQEFLFSDYLWRNKSIANDTILDHRIVLEAYQRGKYVGSLESIPNDCFMIEKSKMHKNQLGSMSQIILSRAFNCEMVNEDFVKELYKGLDDVKMKKRNEQMTAHIRKLLTKNPQQKYLFVVGAAHLFGDISIIQMLQDQFPNDYYIEQIDLANPNFPYQNCTDEEFTRLVNQMNSVRNKTLKSDLFV